jgi:hypothetical protein
VLSIQFKAIQVILCDRITRWLLGPCAPFARFRRRSGHYSNGLYLYPHSPVVRTRRSLRSPTSSQKVTLITMATLQPFCILYVCTLSSRFHSLLPRARCARLDSNESGSVGISAQKLSCLLFPFEIGGDRIFCLFVYRNTDHLDKQFWSALS